MKLLPFRNPKIVADIEEVFKQQIKYSVILKDGSNGITGTTYFGEEVADDDQPCYLPLQFE